MRRPANIRCGRWCAATRAVRKIAYKAVIRGRDASHLIRTATRLRAVTCRVFIAFLATRRAKTPRLPHHVRPTDRPTDRHATRTTPPPPLASPPPTVRRARVRATSVCPCVVFVVCARARVVGRSVVAAAAAAVVSSGACAHIAFCPGLRPPVLSPVPWSCARDSPPCAVRSDDGRERSSGLPQPSRRDRSKQLSARRTRASRVRSSRSVITTRKYRPLRNERRLLFAAFRPLPARFRSLWGTFSSSLNQPPTPSPRLADDRQSKRPLAHRS